MDRIVVGVDGSDAARRALRWAAEEAKRRDARLEVVYAYDYRPASVIYEYPEYGREELFHLDHEVAEQQAQRFVGDLARWAEHEVEGTDVSPVAVNDRRPARALIERAEGATLLVVGSRGRGGFGGLALGSVSQQCAHHAPCPLTLVP